MDPQENKEPKNGYSLELQWCDWAFENPDKNSPVHTALYMWLKILNNRLGWKEKFGVPTYHSMEAIGIKNYRTFKKAFDDLVAWGFVKLHEKAKNNHTSNVIELVYFTKSTTKSSLSHCLSQLPSQVQVTATIDKQLNIETTKQETDGEAFSPFEIITYLNEKTGKQFRANTKNTLKAIEARKNEGRALADFYKVIDNKVADWKGDSKMDKYLCPETLFGPKFEKYLNERIILVKKKLNGPASQEIEGLDHSQSLYQNGSN